MRRWESGTTLDSDFAIDRRRNLSVMQICGYWVRANGQQQVLATESFRNLQIDSTQPNDAAAIVNAGSQLIQLTEAANNANKGKRPAMTGSVSKGNPDPTAVAANDTMTSRLAPGPSSPRQDCRWHKRLWQVWPRRYSH
jgi:hypothetical protein